MSIPDFIYKIKRVGQTNSFLPLYIAIIAVSSLGSFFLGRLSLGELNRNQVLSDNNQISEKDQISDKSEQITTKSLQTAQTINKTQGEGKYVASKNGKLYYSASCKGANRIKPENRVWFDTESDAQKSGYTWATSCK